MKLITGRIELNFAHLYLLYLICNYFTTTKRKREKKCSFLLLIVNTLWEGGTHTQAHIARTFKKIFWLDSVQECRNFTPLKMQSIKDTVCLCYNTHQGFCCKNHVIWPPKNENFLVILGKKLHIQIIDIFLHVLLSDQKIILEKFPTKYLKMQEYWTIFFLKN